MAHILIIDDQEPVRIALAAALQMLGHEVRAAANGAEGLRLFAEDPADLVITDVQMPVKNGFEVLTTLRRDHPDVPVIVMSGADDENTSLYLRLIGSFKSASVSVLRKPFRLLDIEQIVEAALPAPAPSWINPANLRRLFRESVCA